MADKPRARIRPRKPRKAVVKALFIKTKAMYPHLPDEMIMCLVEMMVNL